MMAEEVQPRVRGENHLVDGRLPRLGPFASMHAIRTRRFVREKHVEVLERFTAVDLFPHEVTALVGERGRANGLLHRMRKRGGRRFVPRRRERAAETGNP
jgi:hypothetical protein